ncbi:MAG: hypothetical protein WDM91_20305 [Rhizomicrobium sp.]
MANKQIVQDGPTGAKRSWAVPAIADETLDAGRAINKTSSQAFEGHFATTTNFATPS